MLNATETSAGGSVAAAGATHENQTAVDTDAFTRELENRLSPQFDQEKISVGMNRLREAFPGVDLSLRELGSFRDTASFFLEVDAATTITLSSDVMEWMAEDDETFERVKTMISSLFSASENQGLTAGGAGAQVGVSVGMEETRFVEVQRDANGRALSLVSLALETQKMVADTLYQLLSHLGGRSPTGSASGSSFLIQTNAAASSSWNFGALVSSTSGWQLEGVVAGSSALRENLFASQRMSTSLEVIIEQWEAEAPENVDLFTYMQIMGLADPLVFDLGDEGINLTSAENGVYFDIRGDGTPSKTAWITGNNAFLYLDADGNGVADDANELFGDHGGFANGFAKLAQYDENGDGVIDANDSVFERLRLWRDLDGDGVNQLRESLTLSEAGIASINLKHDDGKSLDKNGNVIGERSTFTRSDGTSGLIADAWLKTL